MMGNGSIEATNESNLGVYGSNKHLSQLSDK